MKKILLTLFLFSIMISTKGQNLVPNGDFETFSSCPNNFSQILLASPWMVPTLLNSSDYYNQCAAGTSVGVPVNAGNGYQDAHSGAGYSGVYIYYNVTQSREYIEVQLTSPLVANQCYHFEMYVNVYNNCMFTTSTMGAYLSDTLLSGINSYTALPYPAQINNTFGNMFDTLNWTLVSGNYTAAGGEIFLTIGNFFDNASTDTLGISLTGIAACYVYIDDVSLTPCTGIEEQNEEAIKIYPNPVKDYLTIQTKEKAEIIITDILGKEVLKSIVNSQLPKESCGQSTINVQSLKDGIYFIAINDGKNSYRKKFLKE
jgi:type IX secretion system substrate protein